MKEDENKFNEILKEKFSSKGFPFEEESWEHLEDKLDASRKIRKIGKTSLIFFLGLFAGVAITMMFMNHEQGSGNEVALHSAGTTKTVPSALENKSSDVQRFSEKQNRDESDASTNNIAGAESHISSTPAILKNESKNNEKTNAAASYVSHSNNNLSNLVMDRKVKNTKTFTSSESGITPGEVSSSESYIQNKSSNTNDVPKSAMDGNHIEKEDQVSDSSLNELKLIAAKGVDVPMRDVSVPEVMLPSLPSILTNISPMRANIFSIEAGTEYTFGWKYGNTVEGKGFIPVLGIGLTHFFNSKWAIYTGAQYGSIAHLAVSQKTFVTSISDFGATNIDSTIDTKWIHYLVVPLFVEYGFDNKNFIGIGGSVSYLVNTTSDVIVNSNSDFQNGEKITKTSSGYTEGFNPWNATVAISYRRKIKKRLSISAEMNYGLLDIKDNAFFNEQIFERSSGIKLLLSYDLVKH